MSRIGLARLFETNHEKEKTLEIKIAFTPRYEQASYWVEWFQSLLTDPRGLLVWFQIFDEVEVASFKVSPGESPEQAKQRHHRKLCAMLEALETLQASALNPMRHSIRKQLGSEFA